MEVGRIVNLDKKPVVIGKAVDYLHLLKDNGHLLGEWDSNKVSGLTPQWFWDRRIDLLDFRGDLQIRSAKNITFGFRVCILTASHRLNEGGCSEGVLKHVWIDECATIFTRALLYNCHIGHHAIVAAGSVVMNMVVPPYTLVEGNPAKITRKYTEGRWKKIT